MKRHSYKLALRAKGIRPIPPYKHLRSAHGAGSHEILNPALAKQRPEGLTTGVRGEAFGPVKAKASATE
jgi:hypothetical protein